MAGVNLPLGFNWGRGNAAGSMTGPSARPGAMAGTTNWGFSGGDGSSSGAMVSLSGNDAISFERRRQRMLTGNNAVNKALQLSMGGLQAGPMGGMGGPGGSGSFGRGGRGGYGGGSGDRGKIKGYSQNYTTEDGVQIPKKAPFGGLNELYALQDRNIPAFHQGAYGNTPASFQGSAGEISGLLGAFGTNIGFGGQGLTNRAGRPIPTKPQSSSPVAYNAGKRWDDQKGWV